MEGGSYLDWTARRRFLWTIGSSLYMATRAWWQGGDIRNNAVQHSASRGGLASAAGEASHNVPGVQKCSSFRFRAILYQIRLQFFSSSPIPPFLANDIFIYQTKCITWIHLTMCSVCILAGEMGFLNSKPAGAAVGDKVTLDRVSIKTGKLGHAALHEHISSG